MSEEPNKDDGLLRSIVWPTVRSVEDAQESSQALGSILACLFAITNLLVGLSNGDTTLILMGLACGAAAYGIWYESVYWLSALIGCLGVINSSTVIYLKYLMIENGAGGGPIAFTLGLLFLSLNAVRMNYLMHKFDIIRKNKTPIKKVNVPLKTAKILPSKSKISESINSEKLNATEILRSKKIDNFVFFGLIIGLLAIVILTMNNEKTNGRDNYPTSARSYLKPIQLKYIQSKEYPNRWVYKIENNSDKLIKKTKIYWMPSACGATTVNEVRTIQRNLKTRGFNPGPIDGSWGPKTIQAMQQFQKTKGLKISKSINKQTASSLNVNIYALAPAESWLDGGSGFIIGDEIKPFSQNFVEFYALFEDQKRMNFSGDFCFSLKGFY